MTHELMPLGYEYDALEPYIDKQTMEIHYLKHHQGYVNKLNAALEKHPELDSKKVEELLSDVNSLPEEIKQDVINNGGGVFNHNFFWQILKKDVEPTGELVEEIKKKFESFEEFKKTFTQAATTVFGSGWAWLVWDKEKKELEVFHSKNQDSPISFNLTPIIGIDVWEHAYYLKYQNKRPDYIEAFFHVINWEKANELFTEAKK